MTTDSRTSFDAADALAAAYLLLPLVLFAFGWFTPAAAAAMTIAALAIAVRFVPRAKVPIGAGWWVAACVLAAAWSALGGAGHFFHANAYDWGVRGAVLRDLAVQDWPVSYGGTGDDVLLLRAPVAYYLPAAALAKLVALARADLLLYGWTALGAGIALVLFTAAGATRLQRWVLLLLFPFFSGMDAVGWWMRKSGCFSAGQHIEWWAEVVQLSSNSTLLFWVPNHCLPGWIAAALILKHRDSGRMPAVFALLAACLPLWAPLVAVGVLPVFAAWLVRNRGWTLRFPAADWISGLAGIALAVLTGLWVTSGTAKVPGGTTIDDFAPEASVLRLLQFDLLEWALLALVISRRRQQPYLPGALVVLAVLPFFRFGGSNDLAMRGTIIPLAILCFYAAEAAAVFMAQARWKRLACWTVLVAVGAVTPAQEIIRAVTQPRWEWDPRSSLPAVASVSAPHYFMLQSQLSRALKPVIKPADPTAGSARRGA